MSGYPLIPASPFFLNHLLGLLFIVHVVFMNFVLAGPFIASGYLFIKGERGVPFARWIAAAHPIAYTFAINSGVAVLLFVQVLFGKQFFTANVILGAKWLSLIALIMISFYGSYIFRNYLHRDTLNPRMAGIYGTLTGGLILIIGMLMVMNHMIGMHEGQWNLLLSNPGKIHGFPTFAPRFLHFVVGSVAISGLWLSWIAIFRRKAGANSSTSSRLYLDGLRIAAIATGLQIVVGVWYLLKLPAETWNRLFSGSVISIVWVFGVGCGLMMLAALILAIMHPERKRWCRVSSLLMFLTLMGMVAGRDLLRIVALGPEFKLQQIPYETQTVPMTLFFIILFIGIGVTVYLIRLMWPKPVQRENDTASSG